MLDTMLHLVPFVLVGKMGGIGTGSERAEARSRKKFRKWRNVRMYAILAIAFAMGGYIATGSPTPISANQAEFSWGLNFPTILLFALWGGILTFVLSIWRIGRLISR